MRLPPPTATAERPLRTTFDISRRALATIAPALLILGTTDRPAFAAPKQYLDPMGRFALEIPDGFAMSKRTATTGTIFVAGNFPRAATISVNAWPLEALVTEDVASQALPGLEAPKAVQLPAAPKNLREIDAALGGDGQALFKVLLRKRDREASSGALSSLPLGDAAAAEDGHLTWSSTTNLPVADPEELFKQRGVRELVRRTTAASYLGSVPDGEAAGKAAVISICASCLQQDWNELGPALEQAVASFTLGAPA